MCCNSDIIEGTVEVGGRRKGWGGREGGGEGLIEGRKVGEKGNFCVRRLGEMKLLRGRKKRWSLLRGGRMGIGVGRKGK